MDASAKKQHQHGHGQNQLAVPPTPIRLRADTSLTARGVTIAFLDSGFYPHADLTLPTNRIVAYADITHPRATLRPEPEDWQWHGTMTSVAAAGNGFLSDGVYRGLASDANVVLVKVSDRGRITEPNIERGLRWVIDNKDRFDIRVVSISLGGDDDVSYKHNAVDQAAEDAVGAGLIVVVAAGNSGCADRHKTVPPANSPSVITVGGYNDNNQIEGPLDLYCSSYGETADGIIKPELVAPAIWVAAPILPGTEPYERAQALSEIVSLPNYALLQLATRGGRRRKTAADTWSQAGLPDSLRAEPVETIRAEVERRIRDDKIVATHYQHVDGTSFAAPIVASVAAQMIEVNPALTPAAVKHILIATADRIQGAPAMRQGYGAVNASRALEQAAREVHVSESQLFCPPRIAGRMLRFTYHDDTARTVAVAGDFNGWNPALNRLERRDGIFRGELEVPPSGRYRYKFVIDDARWVDDPANGMKEPDEYGGFNSVLHIDREAFG